MKINREKTAEKLLQVKPEFHSVKLDEKTDFSLLATTINDAFQRHIIIIREENISYAFQNLNEKDVLITTPLALTVDIVSCLVLE